MIWANFLDVEYSGHFPNKDVIADFLQIPYIILLY